MDSIILHCKIFQSYTIGIIIIKEKQIINVVIFSLIICQL